MSPDREAALDELLAEYLRRLDSGSFDRESFLAEHPDLASDLAELIDAADLVDQYAGPPETDANIGATIGLEGGGNLAPEHVESLGDYDLLDQLGRGGMGVVYRAWQRSMGRHVAVKMILAGRLANQADVHRFYEEARAAGSLRHRHIVAIYQVGESEGRHFYSMDLIEGATLADRIDEGPISPEQAANYLIPIAEATDFAHGQGVLHRDLKPSNVLIDAHDQPRITDFGLAKRYTQPAAEENGDSIVGTPSYMSPEQAAARDDLLGPATDVYSLGAILFAMLTGRPPFRGKNHVEVLLKVMHSNPPDPRKINPRISRDLAAICLKCLHKDPSRRYGTAQELADDLQRFLADEPVSAQPMSGWERAWRWVAGIPLIAALSGRRAAPPSRGQRRAQRAIVAAPIAVAAIWLATLLLNARTPHQTVIFGGIPGGEYARFAAAFRPFLGTRLHRDAAIEPTAGSVENLRRLVKVRGGVALAQEDAIPAGSPELAVATALFWEYVHVLARSDVSVDSLAELADRPIAIGVEGSGTAKHAKQILRLYGGDYSQLRHVGLEALKDGRVDAALFTTALGNQVVRDLLASGDARLLSVPNARAARNVNPHFYRVEISQGDYGEAPDGTPLPPQDVATVGVKTLLLVRDEAPRHFVHGVLEALYEDAPKEFHEDFRLISRETLEGLGSLKWHPAAREYLFGPKRVHGRLASPRSDYLGAAEEGRRATRRQQRLVGVAAGVGYGDEAGDAAGGDVAKVGVESERPSRVERGGSQPSGGRYAWHAGGGGTQIGEQVKIRRARATVRADGDADSGGQQAGRRMESVLEVGMRSRAIDDGKPVSPLREQCDFFVSEKVAMYHGDAVG